MITPAYKITENAAGTSKRRRRRRNGPVQRRRPDAGLYREALVLAGQDPRRIEVHPDGTCTVWNNPVR